MRAFLEQNWWMWCGSEGMGSWWSLKRTQSRNWRNNTLGKLGSQTFKFCPSKCFHFFFLCTLQSKNQGSVFVRIHAPWQVLAREAEFLKIKVPTKKVWTYFSWVWGPPEGWMEVNSLGTGSGASWALWSGDHSWLTKGPKHRAICGWDRKESCGGERGWVWEMLSPQLHLDVFQDKPNSSLIQLLYFSLIPPFSLLLGSQHCQAFL